MTLVGINRFCYVCGNEYDTEEHQRNCPNAPPNGRPSE